LPNGPSAAPPGIVCCHSSRRDQRMRIAVIGTGNMGRGLAKAFARAGHEVVFGSRDPSGARDRVEEAGASGAAPYEDAVRDAEVTVARLARDIGFDPVDVGPAKAARSLTQLLPVLGGLGLGPDMVLKVLRR